MIYRAIQFNFAKKIILIQFYNCHTVFMVLSSDRKKKRKDTVLFFTLLHAYIQF